MASVRVNLIFNVVNNVLRVLFPLITAPYVARVLYPDDLGLFAFGTSYAGYYEVFAYLGIPYYGIREIAKVRGNYSETNRLFSELFTIGILTTIVVSFVFLISIFSFERFYQHYVIFLLLGVCIYFSPLNIEWFYRGLEDFKFITIRSAVIKLFSIVALFSFVRNKDDLLYYVILTVLSTIISDIWNFVVFIKSGYKVSLCLHGLKKHIKPLSLLFLSTIAISIYTILDRLMLGFISSYEQVAFYYYAMQMTKALLIALTSLSVVAMPRVSNYYSKNEFDKIEGLMKKSCSVLTFVSIPLSIGLFLLSPTIVPMYLGHSYISSIMPFQILCMLLVIISMSNLFGVQCLVAFGLDKLYLYSVLFGTLANFGLNMILIPVWGAIGASIASVFAESCVLIVSYYFVTKHTGIVIKLRREILNTLFISLLFVPIYYILVSYFSGILFALLFIIISTIFYLSCQFITRNSSLMLFVDVVREKCRSLS